MAMRPVAIDELLITGWYAAGTGAKVSVFCTRGGQPFVVIKPPSAANRGYDLGFELYHGNYFTSLT
jgi:hypothetical protein